MKVNYETLNVEIMLEHDINALEALKKYNYEISELFYSIIIEDTKKPIFECCREYLNYLRQLDYVIEEQITVTLDDMENTQPADED